MRTRNLGFIPALLIIVQFACNLPQNSEPGEPAPQPPPSEAPIAAPVIPPIEIPAATPTETGTPTATPTPQDPLVLRATLCWRGPGDKYVVVSGLKQSERVKLLGVGSIPGWYIVENPTYHDLCWVQATDLQIEPGTDLASLKVYSPPALKPTKTPIPSATP